MLFYSCHHRLQTKGAATHPVLASRSSYLLVCSCGLYGYQGLAVVIFNSLRYDSERDQVRSGSRHGVATRSRFVEALEAPKTAPLSPGLSSARNLNIEHSHSDVDK